jgi:hypothetical protein
MILNRSGMLSIQLGGKDLIIDWMELSPDARPVFLFSDAGVVIVLTVVAASIAASLYFMWRVRHPKTE